MPEKKVTFRNLAKAWANQNGLHGAHAFLRYVMMTFVECLASTSDQFVFKGGNLLWLYIKTPRSTVDVDFSTKTLKDHARVKALLETACMKASDGISFKVVSFKEITKACYSSLRYILPI
ncbi:MAG: nucleotidyl transferase AbiEii/AbiGii toxin family protein [Proteobacteria bacterium]|nr:nucleotidyl transferase AbiEii/AbiGii toxin family protein [Pseudomonadota bacterium]